MKIKCKDCGVKVTKKGNNLRCRACASARRRVKCRKYDETRRERNVLRRAIRDCVTDIVIVPQGNGKVSVYARDDYMDLIS